MGNAQFRRKKIIVPDDVQTIATAIFDLLLPRILTSELLNADIITEMEHGGLCLNCPQCRFPACAFGR